jgi:transcriptional regulator with XRE-family HTH domain
MSVDDEQAENEAELAKRYSGEELERRIADSRRMRADLLFLEGMVRAVVKRRERAERDREIKELLGTDMTQQDIAAEVGCSQGYVSQIARQARRERDAEAAAKQALDLEKAGNPDYIAAERANQEALFQTLKKLSDAFSSSDFPPSQPKDTAQ